MFANYIIKFIINKFKNWASNASTEFLSINGIKPGTKEYASVGYFGLPFVVGENYVPQFDIDSIYQELIKRYSN